jgi:hypothetical protein
MLPSVNAQKPDVTEPSGASVDVTPKAIVRENAVPIDLIRSAIDASAQAVNQPANGHTVPPDAAAFLRKRVIW